MEQAVQESSRRRGFRYWVPRILLGIVILLLIPIVMGTGWQFLAQRAEGRQVLPLGQLTNVDDRFIHIYCTGQSSPTVILEGGVPEWSIHWQKVQPEIAKFTRVCSYDRAGYGWSETGPSPRTAERIVSELHALLRNSGETGPFVYVTHSFWGPAALLYQQTYPEEVAGMVLIEAWSPDLFTPAPEVITQSLPLAKTLKTLAPFGQLRLFGELGILPPGKMLKSDLLPDELQSSYKAAYYDDRMWNAMYEEYSAMEESGRQTKDITSLGDLPLVVIKAGVRPADDYPPDDVWNATQDHLAGLSPQGELIVDETSGHFVQMENPALVVDAVRKVIEKSTPNDQPPPAILQIGGEKQTAGLGSYCWNYINAQGDGVGACLDTIGLPTPRDPLLAKSPATAKLTLRLEGPPDLLQLSIFPAAEENEVKMDDLPAGFRYWMPAEGVNQELDPQTSLDIPLDLEPGLYVFNVFANWDVKGDASYGFLVEVQ